MKADVILIKICREALNILEVLFSIFLRRNSYRDILFKLIPYIAWGIIITNNYRFSVLVPCDCYTNFIRISPEHLKIIEFSIRCH